MSTSAPATPSGQVYANLLAALTEREKSVQTRVVVDAVAGTSAGGNNGICLAKTLTDNRSQDELRRLWFNHGDIDGSSRARVPRAVPDEVQPPARSLALRAHERSGSQIVGTKSRRASSASTQASMRSVLQASGASLWVPRTRPSEREARLRALNA